MGKPRTPAPMLTRAAEDYLKAVYRLEREEGLATTRRLSQALGLSDASVTNMSKRLHTAELVRHTRYRGVVLTEEGLHRATKVLRRHHLIAMFLIKTLGCSRDEVGHEADRLEHHVSDQLADRINAFLDYPPLSDEPDENDATTVPSTVVLLDRQDRS